MIQLYILTGFLGAGKTTLLKEMINLFGDKRLAIIVNEFGKENIDSMLLKNTGVSLSGISDGSIFCSCKLDQFEEVLLKTAQKEPEVIIVEASGLSNPQNVYKILGDTVFKSIDFKGSICLVDAVNFHKVVYSALACKQQLSIADIVIINKTDLVSYESLEQTKKLICSFRTDVPIFETSFGRIEADWLGQLQENRNESHPLRQVQDITLQKFLLDVTPIKTIADLQRFISSFANNTYRVKGFVFKNNINWLVDCVGGDIKITHFDGTITALDKLVILSGNGLPAYKSINKSIKDFCLSKDILE